MCNNWITQFYLPPTHEPYLPLLPSRKVSPPFGRNSLPSDKQNLFVLSSNVITQRRQFERFQVFANRNYLFIYKYRQSDVFSEAAIWFCGLFVRMQPARYRKTFHSTRRRWISFLTRHGGLLSPAAVCGSNTDI